jgi:iron complex outermembrane receptor protein
MRPGMAAAIETNDKGKIMAIEHLTSCETSNEHLRPGSLPALLMLLCAPASMVLPHTAFGQSVGSEVTRIAAADTDEHSQADGSRESREPDAGRRGGRAIEEIIVSAQKREERLQDVPISISVLDGVDLDKSTASGVTETLSQVPGAAINVINQGGGTLISMRGVAPSGALFGGSSPISYYLDSVPFGLVRQAIAPDANAYDLQRIEVLRGPQGTLYGASAQNGVIRVLTNDANPDEFELKGRASTSNTEDGGWNYRGDMSINVPIIEGKLAARAVVGYQDSSGWIERLNKNDVNDAEILNTRLKINARPTDELSIGLSVWRSRADYGAPSVSADNGVHNATLDEPISTDFDVYGLKIQYEFPWASISSSSSYLEYLNDGYLDVGGLIPGRLDRTKLDADLFAQEIVLTSTLAGPWRWTLGGMYRNGEDRQYQRSYFPAQGTSLTPSVNQYYASESFAFFGELTRAFSNGKLELSAGLRYFEDRVTSQDDVRSLYSRSRFDAVSPRVALTWHPSEDLTIYGSYAEGFRSGFPQAGSVLFFAPQFKPVDADTLHNYELGAKGSLWGRLVEFDLAVYYIDWEDVQQALSVRVPANSGGLILTIANVNSESASGVGVDVGITLHPTDNLELGATFSWNDLTMDADVFSGDSLLFARGDRLANSPECTASAWAALGFPLGSRLSGRIAASANYVDPMTAPREAFPGDAMLIGRASFEVDASSNWTATLFVDNFTDERDAITRIGFFRDVLTWDTRVRPRTIGMQLEYRF